MNRLIVFIGLPGVGKTTLIDYLLKDNQGFTRHDVLPYINKFKDEQGFLIDESMAIIAYRQMYEDLFEIKKDCILELGTNYPEYNVEQLNKLAQSRQVKIFLCLLDQETCLKRARARDRAFSEEQLTRRFARGFPKDHDLFIKKHKLAFQYLDMKQKVEDLYKLINI